MSTQTATPSSPKKNARTIVPQSNASASSASTYSQDGNTSDTSIPNGKVTTNAPVAEDLKRPAPPLSRPSMKTRLTGMFGRKENGGESSRDGSQKMKETTIAGENEHANGTKKGSPPPPTGRCPQTNGISPVDRTKSFADKKTEDPHFHKRFAMTADGLHEHNLKAQKRNQKLKDMVRNIFEKKKDCNEEQPLTLMADWIAQKRAEANA